MELVLFNQPNEPFFREAINLAEKKVNTINGLIIMTKKEKEELIAYSREIYQNVYQSVRTDFFGHIRMDLVPGVKNLKKTVRGYSWDFFIEGIYEINSNSPECGAAVSALHHEFPIFAKYQPNPSERIVKVLNGYIYKKKIGFVIGNGIVKKEWGKIFMNSLKSKGLLIEEITMEQVESYDIVWRFGDVRESEDFSEFPRWFKELLWEKQKHSSLILNTVTKSSEEDIGNKKYLLNKPYERELKSKEDVFWAINSDKDLVLKPFQGASGKDITFRANCSNSQWEKTLNSCVNNDFGLFEARWLPRLEIDQVSNGIAIDISPSFFAKGKEIEYLYSVVRIEEYSRYKKRGTINVAKGAGFVGTLID